MSLPTPDDTILTHKEKLMIKRILITEDHSVVRLGIVLLVKDLFTNAEIKEADTFDAALAHLDGEPIDLMILDVNIPGGGNTGMIEVARFRQPKIRILIFSAYNEKLYALRFIKEGANGYISKDAGQEEIKKAILTVLGGNTYMSNEVQADLIASMQTNKAGAGDEILSLSNREIEIAELLIRGFSTNMIAEKLHLQKSTVSTHKANIFEKMNVENIPDLAVKAGRYFEERNTH